MEDGARALTGLQRGGLGQPKCLLMVVVVYFQSLQKIKTSILLDVYVVITHWAFIALELHIHRTSLLLTGVLAFVLW